MVRPAPSALLGEELRGLVLASGGHGCICVATALGLWASEPALEALVRAAHRLGFSRFPENGIILEWHAVVKAIAAGCWIDLLSEAIEDSGAAAPSSALGRTSMGHWFGKRGDGLPPLSAPVDTPPSED